MSEDNDDKVYTDTSNNSKNMIYSIHKLINIK